MRSDGNRVMRIALHGTLLVLLIVGGLGLPPLLAPAGSGIARIALAAKEECPDPQERAFLRTINRYRNQKGLTPLALDKSLMLAAHNHSFDMTKMAQVRNHNLRGGITAKQNLINYGYPANRIGWGENLAFGTALDTAAEAFKGWKKSAGHNRNMLKNTYRAIGIARVHDPNSTYGWYWTTTFGASVETRPTC